MSSVTLITCFTTDLTFWAQGYAANFDSDPLFSCSDQLQFGCHKSPRLSARCCAYLPWSWWELFHSHYTTRSQAEPPTQPALLSEATSDCSIHAWALFAIISSLEPPLHPTKYKFLVFIIRLHKDLRTCCLNFGLNGISTWETLRPAKLSLKLRFCFASP